MADYPREIHLDDDTQTDLQRYLDQELANHYAERGSFVDDLIRWQKDYWAKPSTERATFPFTGASTIVIPLTAIAVETIHARTMTTLFGGPQFTSVKSLGDASSDLAVPLERYLDYELLERAKIKKPITDASLETVKFGVCVGKSGFEKIVRKAIRTNAAGDETEFPVTVKNGVTVDCVPVSRFIMPYTAQDAQTAAWCGEEHTASEHEIRQMVKSGLFREEVIQRLEEWIGQGQIGPNGERKFDEAQSKLEDRNAIWPRQLDWAEVWLTFDVDGDGEDEEIVAHYHRQSGTFFSIRYNWLVDLRRPYRSAVYFPLEHRWTGIGVAKQNEQFMREITTQHRQRLDNATLANMRMIKVSKLSGYGAKEPIFPGKMWILDDMTHVESMQMGEIYPSAYNNEQATLIYSQQRTGVNEVTMGMPQVGTPGTATSDLARIQEGNKKFDYTYGNFKQFVNELVLDSAACMQQFGPRSVTYVDKTDSGGILKAFFDMPEGDLRDNFLISIHAAGQQENKVIDRQNWTQIASMTQQYYTNLIQLAMQTQNGTLLQEIMQKAMSASSEMFKQILQSFDVRNIDRLIVQSVMQNGSQSPADTTGASGVIPTGASQPVPTTPQAVPQIAGSVGPTASSVQGR